MSSSVCFSLCIVRHCTVASVHFPYPQIVQKAQFPRQDSSSLLLALCKIKKILIYFPCVVDLVNVTYVIRCSQNAGEARATCFGGKASPQGWLNDEILPSGGLACINVTVVKNEIDETEQMRFLFSFFFLHFGNYFTFL